MTKKHIALLDFDLGPTTDVVKKANEASLNTHKNKEEVPIGLLDEIIDKSGYGSANSLMRTQVSTTINIEEEGSIGDTRTEYCLINGIRLPMNTEITIDPALITQEFKGNTRNKKFLKNIDELAKSIIPDGHNSEPVKARPLKDGSGLELVKGKRRTAAVKRALELTTKPVSLRIIIANLDDKEATREAAMENVGKENLSPWELGDQLQSLLDSGAVDSVAKLSQYLPIGDKKVARTTISTWLEPAKIDTDIRKYVDESLPIKNSAITKLHRRWTALINKMSREVVLQKLSDSFLTGKHEVKDIIDFINHIEGIQKDNRNFTVSSIKNSHGDLVATIKQKLNGGISINFEKHVEEGTIDALKATIEEKLSQL